jgi:hypothetical protein
MTRGYPHYLGMYLTVAAVVAVGAIVSLGLYARQRHQARDHRTPVQRSRWTLAPEEASDADT